MKIGMFTANFMDHDLESVFKMMAEMGYETAELPAFSDNGHLDIDEVLTGNGAKKIKSLAENYGLTISALSNHTEGQLVLGPHTKDTDAFCKGTPAEKIKFGMERMKKTARAHAGMGASSLPHHLSFFQLCGKQSGGRTLGCHLRRRLEGSIGTGCFAAVREGTQLG